MLRLRTGEPFQQPDVSARRLPAQHRRPHQRLHRRRAWSTWARSAATYPAQLNLAAHHADRLLHHHHRPQRRLTGASGTISGVDTPVPTTSISRNAFFDAPGAVGRVRLLRRPDHAIPGGHDQSSPPCSSTAPDADYVRRAVDLSDHRSQHRPAHHRRQLTADRDLPPVDDQQGHGHLRAGVQHQPARPVRLYARHVHDRPQRRPRHLPDHRPAARSERPTEEPRTTSIPAPRPCSRRRASGASRRTSCVPATFAANGRYVVYNLFARNDTVISYQLYVGDSVPDGGSSRGPGTLRARHAAPHVDGQQQRTVQLPQSGRRPMRPEQRRAVVLGHAEADRRRTAS